MSKYWFRIECQNRGALHALHTARSSYIFDDIVLDEEECENINFEHNLIIEEFVDKDQEVGSLVNFNDRVPNILGNIKKDYCSLTVCQKRVVEYIQENLNKQNLIFIWGAAGTGKTFLIDYLSRMFLINNKEVAKLATTGLAAKLIKCRTFHSFFSD